MALSSPFKKAGATANDASVAAKSLLAAELKKGKDKEQCKAIDFFIFGDTNLEKKGCFKKVAGMIPGADGKVWTMDEYLTHVQTIVDGLNLRDRAIEKIGLDESQITEIPDIYISSFGRGDGLYRRRDRERRITVTNKYHVTYIFFSATQLYTYTYEFDTTSDKVLEYTRDFFYSDITCIVTEHEVEEEIYEIAESKGCFKKMGDVKYVRTHTNWDTLKITVPNNDFYFYCKTTPTIEQSIQAAKAMIREKKQA